MMKFRIYHTPYFLRLFYRRDATWQIKTDKKELFLTFDDGPTTEMTQWILDTLKLYNAKATFFCVGENVKNNPEIYNQIIMEGHAIGNHTYNHLNGLKTNDEEYIKNVSEAKEYIDSPLFRPPYGRIKRSQFKRIQNLGYRIILWSILSYDFDKNLNREKAWKQIVKHTKPVSIIVFHDNIKAFDNLKVLLPKTLDYFSQMGYSFKILD